ncbi:MAG: ATP-dependent RNA helicase HrpA [Pseudomonadota bacterium]
MTTRPDLNELLTRIDSAQIRDRHPLRRKVRELTTRERRGESLEGDWAALNAHLDRSIAQSDARLALPFSLSYPDHLPVTEARERVRAAIDENQVVVVCGDTGSGKTTQLPKICLELGRGCHGLIGHTQPRRIAARSVAERIARELQTEPGNLVGHTVRFSDTVSDTARVKLMTDGILLAEIQRDPWLNAYDTLIVDEAHDRSLNIDFLLGYLAQLLPRRPDLKLIITSATIDPERFAAHFAREDSEVPILRIEGRTYPVEIRYRPTLDEETGIEADPTDALIDAAEELAHALDGDILAFFPSERDIREAAKALQKHAERSKRLRGLEILPLFGRLSFAEQQKVFKRGDRRRIVLATNVAETSLTVPGIRAVIDTGTARVSRYSASSKLQRLPIEPISQASALQRSGRCGREAPGIAIRLYSEDDFNGRPQFTDPEILRTNLASVILQMAALRLSAVEDFPFVEPPERRFINDGYLLLHELGAVDDTRKLTSVGRRMARLPVDPRLARMLLAADREACLDEVLTIVAALSIQDPRERPLDAQAAADQAHAEHRHEQSDFLSFNNLWSLVEVQRKALSGSAFRRWCKAQFLSYLRLREWMDIRRQLADACRSLKLRPNDKEAPADNIHRAVLAGLLSHIARKTEKGDFAGARGRKLHIFPGSSLKRRSPNWLVAAEIVETSRVFGRCVAPIDPRWLEPLAPHLLKYNYFSPRWQRKRGQVGAYAKVVLYGLIVNPKKRVNYGPIDPSGAREIFIREALVAGEFNTQGGFLAHNLELVDGVRQLEDKSRRRDILVDPDTLADFYQARIPDHVYNQPAFEKWRQKAEQETPKLLFFDAADITAETADPIDYESFPDTVDIAGAVLPLRYHFAPGSEDDGVTLSIPLALLNRVGVARCEYVVPGLLYEKIESLLRSLPKFSRKQVVPVPDVARELFTQISPSDTSLCRALCNALKSSRGVDIAMSDWNPDVLAPHLFMRFELVGSDGSVLTTGRDLGRIQRQFQGQVEQSLSEAPDNSFERDNLTDWRFGDLPEQVDIDQGGITLPGYPALVDQGTSVAIRVYGSAARAAREHRLGARRLYALQLRDEIRYLNKQLKSLDKLALRFAGRGTVEELKEDLLNSTLDRAFLDGRPLPRQREVFLTNLSTGRQQLQLLANELRDQLIAAIEACAGVEKRIRGNQSLAWVEAVADITDQIDHLIYPGMLAATPSDRLKRFALFFKAIDRRLDAIDRAPDKDRRLRSELLPLWERFKSLPTELDDDLAFDTDWLALRWQFEELRISLFAQELGTLDKVSTARIEKRVEALERRV